jgi:hypothetical protein
MSGSRTKEGRAGIDTPSAENGGKEAQTAREEPSSMRPVATPSATERPQVDDYRTKAQSFRRFRLAQDFDRVAGVTKVIVTVRAQKPGGQAWFRVHPDERYRMQVALLKLKDENEVYLIDPSLVGELAAEVVPHMLFTYTTRQNAIALWPARLPRGDGRTDHWMRSEHEAANLAMTRWVRMTANMPAGSFDVHVSKADLADPEWPDVSFDRLLELAFSEHIVEDLNHPVLRRLRGEI